MLRKLIGYEFRATRRIYLPAFLAIAVLSLLNGVLFATVWNADTFFAPAGVIFTLYIFALFAVWVMALVYTITRFNNNLLKDEGYLMFTLPARPSQLIWSKAIVSVIWVVLTGILCLISLAVIMTPAMLASTDDMIMWSAVFSRVPLMLSKLWEEFGVSVITLPIEALVGVIAGLFGFCMKIYACLAIGNLFQRHRTAWAFGAYVLFGVIVQVVAVLAANIAGWMIPSGWMSFFMSAPQTVTVNVMLLLMVAVSAVQIVIYFVITNYILSRRLNLQ